MGQSKTPNCFIVTEELTSDSILNYTNFVPEVYIVRRAAWDRALELNDARRPYSGTYFLVSDAELKQ